VLAGLAASAAPVLWAQTIPLVELVRTEPTGVQADVMAAIQRELAGLPVRVRPVLGRLGGLPEAERPALVVSLGALAFADVTARAAQVGSPWQQVPVLAGLLGQNLFRSRQAGLPRGSSALWLDQPLERYLDLVRLVLPRQPRVGVLLGPTSASMAPALERAAAARGLTLVQASIKDPTSELYPALQAVLQDADILLALPDPILYNPQSLQNVLIATYRQRVPVLSYALPHVRAGATLALHTPWEASAARLGGALKSWLSGRGLPSPSGVPAYAVAINEQVARSLSLNLPEAEALESALQRAEVRGVPP